MPKSNDALIMIRLPASLLRRLDALARTISKETGIEVKRATYARKLIVDGVTRETAARA
jgi:predicted DNA-binding protein